MLDSLIKQLDSGDPAQRRQAIIALGRTRDMAALPALAKVFREDPDPELRELARKAGTYIRQKNDEAAAPAAAAEPEKPSGVPLRVYETPKPEEMPKGPEIPVRGREYTVSAANKKRAKEYVEAALGANMRGDNARGMKDLAQAITLDPNLINDPYFGSVAASVTGVSGDEAVRMILDSGQRKQFVQKQVTKVKEEARSRQREKAERSDMGGVAFEMAIYVFINLVFPFLILFIAFELAKNTFGGAVLAEEDAETFRDLNAFFTLPIGVLLIAGLVSGVSLVISTLFQTFMIHISALLLGGVGTFLHLLDVLLQFYNRYQPVLYILFGVNIIIAIVTLGSPLIICSTLVLLIFSLYFAAKTVGKIGEAYGFGMGMGCLTLLIATAIIVLINALIGVALSSVVTSWLTSFLETVPIPTTGV